MNNIIQETKRIWLTIIGCIVFTALFTVSGCKLILYVNSVCSKNIADFIINAVTLFFAICLLVELMIAKKIIYKEDNKNDKG